MKGLTNAQARVLDAVRLRAANGESLPTYRELQAELGFKSTGSVRDHLRALARKGFLSLGAGRARSARLAQEFVHATRIPVLGRVVAGRPTPAQEELEGFVDVPWEWVRGDTFALKVVGDSMRDAGILEGDVAVLRRDQSPRKWQIVCATLDGETTLKYFEPRKDGVWLVPANSRYRPIRVPDESIIQGVVQATLRLYQTPSRTMTRTTRDPSRGGTQHGTR